VEPPVGDREIVHDLVDVDAMAEIGKKRGDDGLRG